MIAIKMTRHKTIHDQRYAQLIEQLCDERKRLGLSQKEVAAALKMSQSEISKIETNERRIDILELKEMLTFYRIGENKKLQYLIAKFIGLDI